MHRPTITRGLVALCAAAAAAGGLAACGSSSDDGGSASTAAATQAAGSTTAGSTTTASTAAASSGPAYDGPEKGLPASFPDPTIKEGTSFKLGYLSPFAADEGLAEEADAMKAETEKLGGQFVLYDTKSNAQIETARFNDLITQGVDVIVIQPSVPDAVKSLIAKANAKGIEVVAVSTPADAALPAMDGLVTNVLHGVDQCAYLSVKAVAEADPGGKVSLIGTSLPFPALQYLVDRQEYWIEKFGLQLQGKVEAKTPAPTEGTTAMTAILARYPDTTSVIAWTDPQAQAAAVVAKSNGKDINFAGVTGAKAAKDAVAAGNMLATCDYDLAGAGRQAAIAGYEAITGAGADLPKQILVPPTLVTKAGTSTAVEG